MEVEKVETNRNNQAYFTLHYRKRYTKISMGQDINITCVNVLVQQYAQFTAAVKSHNMVLYLVNSCG